MERKCILSGELKPKENLIRFVRDPDGNIMPDIKGNLPGRGVWVSANYRDVKAAAEKDLFSKAYKSRLRGQENLAELTKELLFKSALSWLSMANKSGNLVCGRTRVEKAINKHKAAMLLEAVDGAEDGKKKIRSLKKALESETGIGCELVSLFSVAQMSAALGRENVVHAAITNRHMASSFAGVLSKLKNYI